MRNSSNFGSRRTASIRKGSKYNDNEPEEEKLSLYEKLSLNQFSFQKTSADLRTIQKGNISSPNSKIYQENTYNAGSLGSKQPKDMMDELDELVANLNSEPGNTKSAIEDYTYQRPRIYDYNSPIRSSTRNIENPKASIAAKCIGSSSHGQTLSSTVPPDGNSMVVSAWKQGIMPNQPGVGTSQPFTLDLGDTFTAHEVWTTFEAAKHFHHKVQSGSLHPPVDYTLPNESGSSGPAVGNAESAASQTASGSTLTKILKKICGHERFLLGQEPLLAQLQAGGDAYSSGPMGMGRGLVYQVLGLASPGFTLVLGKDPGAILKHVFTVRRMDVPCLFQEQASEDTILKGLKKVVEERKCTFKFLFITPGKPSFTPQIQELLRKCHAHKSIQRIVIYDVNLLSKLSSGYSQQYVDLVSSVLDSFRSQGSSQLTPTETSQPNNTVPQLFTLSTETSRFIREDTMDFLGMNKPVYFCSSFWRPNLRHIVTERRQAEVEQLAAILYENYQGQSGLIYVNDIASCERVKRGIIQDLSTRTPKATDKQFTFECFHQGLVDSERDRITSNWITGQTQVLVICVEGLSIKWDKADIRFTIHFHLPKSLQHYYNQSGVCGRDGSLSDCVLLYSTRDVNYFEDRSSCQQTALNSVLQQQGITSELITSTHDMGWVLGQNRFEFNEVVRYAEERTQCRKQLLCAMYGQVTKKEDCKSFCDNCNANWVVKTSNHIQLVRKILAFYADVARSESIVIPGSSQTSKNPDLTLKQLVEVLRGTFTPNTPSAEQKVPKALALNGLAADIDKKELEYVLTLLLRSSFLKSKPQLSPHGPYSTLTLDPLYQTFYSSLLSNPDARFTVKSPQKRRNQESMESFAACKKEFDKLRERVQIKGEVGDKSKEEWFEMSPGRFEIEKGLQAGGEEVGRWVREGGEKGGYLWKEEKEGDRSNLLGADPSIDKHARLERVESPDQVCDELDDLFEKLAIGSPKKAIQAQNQPQSAPISSDPNGASFNQTQPKIEILRTELASRFELITGTYGKIEGKHLRTESHLCQMLIENCNNTKDDLRLLLKSQSGIADEVITDRLLEESLHFFTLYRLKHKQIEEPEPPNLESCSVNSTGTTKINSLSSFRKQMPKLPTQTTFENAFSAALEPVILGLADQSSSEDRIYISFLKFRKFVKWVDPILPDPEPTKSEPETNVSPSKIEIESESGPTLLEELFSLNVQAPCLENSLPEIDSTDSTWQPETQPTLLKGLPRPSLPPQGPFLGKRLVAPTLIEPDPPRPPLQSVASDDDFGVIVIGSDSFPEYQDDQESQSPLPSIIKEQDALPVAVHSPERSQESIAPRQLSPDSNCPPPIVPVLMSRPRLSTIRIVSSPKKPPSPSLPPTN